MFMNDVHKKDEIKELAIQNLRQIGIKYRKKKTKPNVQEAKKSARCFKTDLNLLPSQVVTLADGQQLVVPVIVHELCSFILNRFNTVGLFRKDGSKSRQNEIKLSLNAGCKLEDDYHEIDVAAILKLFLRELPEPLIPTMFHDYFLRCTILDKQKLEAILLLCLLLPQVHLNTLAYLLRFFKTLSDNSKVNKMPADNLAVLIAPNIFPMNYDKTIGNNQFKLKKILDLIQLLIENANKIGIIPEHIIDQVANLTTNQEDVEVPDKKKKRRSGSLTRMLSGLKRIVSTKTDESSTTIVTPDLLLTPSITRSAKKRKNEVNVLSNRKKREVISNLPEGKLLKTPFTPISTPISKDPNPKTDKRKSLLKEAEKKEKKSQWYNKNKTSKTNKNEDEENIRSSRLSLGPRSLIERRWSAVSNVAGFRRKKRNSFGGSRIDLEPESTPKEETITTADDSEESYVKISKVEYEQIKSRVSAIEETISKEMVIVQSQMDEPQPSMDTVKTVQTAYEQTLVQTEPLSPTTDHLARRLSRELKIRRSNENMVIRSPSARKIGSLKRRSRELERNSVKLSRNQSWHFDSKIAIPRVNLKKNPSNELSTPNRVLRSHSINSSIEKSFYSATSNVDKSDSWISGEKFFSTVKTPSVNGDSSNNSRPSVAKLRSQNAGMVLAKAKLFDTLNDSGKPNRGKTTSHKIGGVRQSIRKQAKKVSSPRRNRMNLSQKKLQLVDAERKREAGFVISPLKPVPVIKRPLLTKSPKRLCRTPGVEKGTPLKVFTPRPMEY